MKNKFDLGANINIVEKDIELNLSRGGYCSSR